MTNKKNENLLAKDDFFMIQYAHLFTFLCHTCAFIYYLKISLTY